MIEVDEVMPVVSVEQVESLEDADLAELCDAAEVAILDGGGFGWLSPPPREVMERMGRGEDIQASEYYHRVAPFVETTSVVYGRFSNHGGIRFEARSRRRNR